MKLSLKLIACRAIIVGTVATAAFAIMLGLFDRTPTVDSHADLSSASLSQITPASRDEIVHDTNIQLCQGYENVATCGCQGVCNGSCGVQVNAPMGMGMGYPQAVQPSRMMRGIGQNTGREARWRQQTNVPFEQFAYGEYLGPHRTPHVAEYRLRVNDQLEFVYVRTREKTFEPYQLYVGDVLQVSSAIDASLNQSGLTVRSDGMISLSLIGQIRAAGKTIDDLQRELNDKYTEFVNNPSIVVQVTQGDTPLRDILDSVDARAGQGGQARAVTVSPDGTVQLPGIGSVPAIGLTLDEIGREVNARYRLRLGGIEVTPILIERAPRFIFVVGEATRPGRFELTGPTTVMQAVALAEGFSTGGNLRQVIVFRRDQNWRLTATRLDLAGALYGKRPHPSDEIWLRDSDIVLIPKKPIQRLSEAVNLYLSNTLYSIFPQQGVAFNFDDFTAL
ncbi:MAG: polysaccharide biosynthesis/export family protein [Mariniblastus sp.]